MLLQVFFTSGGASSSQRDRLSRVTGRVELALRDRDIQPPILLPANHPVMIRDKANNWSKIIQLHTGVKTTLSELKEKYWIVKGRQQERNVWLACVKCQKLTSPLFRQLAAPLPANLLRDARAFEITGVDFVGPLQNPSGRPGRFSFFGKTWLVQNMKELNDFVGLCSRKFVCRPSKDKARRNVWGSSSRLRLRQNSA